MFSFLLGSTIEYNSEFNFGCARFELEVAIDGIFSNARNARNANWNQIGASSIGAQSGHPKWSLTGAQIEAIAA